MSACLANPTAHTGYEPNFYTHMNGEHTPINLRDSHRNFPRRDDATTITTEDPKGFPHSRASRGSGNSGGIMSRLTVGMASRKLVSRIWTVNLLFQLFSVYSQWEERSRHKRCDRERQVDSAVRGERVSAKNVWSWGRSWGEKLGKTTSGFRFSRDQSRIRILAVSATVSKSIGEFVAKKLIKLDKQELKNCLCNERGILRLWVNYWLKFRVYRIT